MGGGGTIESSTARNSRRVVAWESREGESCGLETCSSPEACTTRPFPTSTAPVVSSSTRRIVRFTPGTGSVQSPVFAPPGVRTPTDWVNRGERRSAARGQGCDGVVSRQSTQEAAAPDAARHRRGHGGTRRVQRGRRTGGRRGRRGVTRCPLRSLPPYTPAFSCTLSARATSTPGAMWPETGPLGRGHSASTARCSGRGVNWRDLTSIDVR